MALIDMIAVTRLEEVKADGTKNFKFHMEFAVGADFTVVPPTTLLNDTEEVLNTTLKNVEDDLRGKFVQRLKEILADEPRIQLLNGAK